MEKRQKQDEIDNMLIDRLTQNVDSMIKTLNQKGITDFSESAKLGMLRIHTYKLITTLQFHKVLPDDLHIKDGTLLRHQDEILKRNS